MTKIHRRGENCRRRVSGGYNCNVITIVENHGVKRIYVLRGRKVPIQTDVIFYLVKIDVFPKNRQKSIFWRLGKFQVEPGPPLPPSFLVNDLSQKVKKPLGSTFERALCASEAKPVPGAEKPRQGEEQTEKVVEGEEFRFGKGTILWNFDKFR